MQTYWSLSRLADVQLRVYTNRLRPQFPHPVMSLHTGNVPSVPATARTSFVPAAPSSSSAANPSSQTPTSHHAMPPELESTLAMLSSHRSVLGYLLVTRGHPHGIIRQSGVIFEGEQGRKYAAVVARTVENVQSGLEELRSDDGVTEAEPADEIRFMRIRTKRHEIMISPDERYVLAVLHDPTT